ncbi:MAG TPA: site-specific DNA-methyltransferase [Candidatus Omnitrophota bacterium]|nr:site-specific DNA-methyltransferase [Candidatus Omnitrophota bacterium]
MKSEMVKISDIQLAEYNPRKMSEDEFMRLVRSIEEFGFVSPVLINKDGTCIGGHQRISAAQYLGMSEVPAMKIDLSKPKEKALNLALNRISGEWDYAKLTDVLMDLDTGEIDLDLTGFAEKEIARLIDYEPSPERKDELFKQQLPEDPDTKFGDIFQLGPHRLMCADATDPLQIEKLMDGKKAKMCFTDPPYNVNYKATKEYAGERGIKGDNVSRETFEAFCQPVFKNIEAFCQPGAAIYVCSGFTSFPVFLSALERNNLKIAGTIIWVKSGGASLGWNDYRHKHEWVIKAQKRERRKGVSILYAHKEGPQYFRDTRDEYDVWELPRKASINYLHPTEKPLWLPRKAIQNSSKPGELVLEPFAGSGATLIAAHISKRICYATELDPRFCDVIIKRWENLSGEKAVKVNGQEDPKGPAGKRNRARRSR